MPPESSNNSSHRFAALPPWIGVALIAMASLNTWALMCVLFVARIDPVHYAVVWPGGGGLRKLVAGGLVPLGVLVVGVVIAVAMLRVRARRISQQPIILGDWRWAWWPSALAPAWIVVWLPHPRLSFLVVFACIAATAWSVGRFVMRVSTPIGEEIENEASGELQRGGHNWWRSPWFGALSLVALLLVAFHTFVQIRLYRSLQYGSPDIGYYAEMLVNVLRGRGLYCEAFGHHYFGEHFSPGLYLLTALWAMCPRIETLMVVSALAVIAGCVPVYGLVRRGGGSAAVAFMIGLAYLLVPSTSRVIYGASYGFHEILIAIPLMLWSFHAFRARRRWLALVFALLALSFKENVAVVYGALGLCVYVHDRRSRWGLWLCLACAAYFATCVFWIVPSFNTAGDYSKYYLYGQLGGMDEIVRRLLSWQTLAFGLSLLVPVALWPMRTPLLLAGLPTFAFICLMDTREFASVRFWHQSSIIPIIFLATAHVLTDPRRDRYRRAGIAAAVLCAAALTHYGLGFSPVSRMWRDVPLRVGDHGEQLRRLHELISVEDTVQATPRLAAHFYDQQRVYPMHVDPPVPPRWVLIDTSDRMMQPHDLRRARKYARRLLETGRYRIEYQAGSIRVLKLSITEHDVVFQRSRFRWCH